MISRRIEVWHRLHSDHKYVGEMICQIDDLGKAYGAFRYDQKFLASPDAFVLDPVSLDPSNIPQPDSLFSIGTPGIFRVFEDSLPDDWGRRLLVRKHKTPRADQNLPTLLLIIGSSGLGALSYVEHGKPARSAPEKSTKYLSELVNAAEAFERGDILEPELNLLFGASSSPGGARPKALVYDESAEIYYLAKFPSIKDDVNVVRIEAATMTLAEASGLTVPKTRLVNCGGRDILLVKRFDVIDDFSRRHMISLQTLLKAEGYYQSRYYEILKIVRKYSSNPAVDSDLLFRQMVLNAVIGNTDDHLKNFWMLFCHKEGWRLSPSFDLVPDIRRSGEHVLFFEDGPYHPGRQKLVKLGRSWGISNAAAAADQVYDAVSCWREVYLSSGVPQIDVDYFKEIDINLKS